MTETCTDQKGDTAPQPVSDEQQMFEPLCERLLCAMSLLQTSLSEMLDLKDELMLHKVPSSLMARLSIASGRLFRSVSDLSVPSMELVRLVQVHSTPWEEKRQILEKLHSDSERKRNYLSVALRRLQLLKAQSQSVAHYKRIGNWERLFARLMSAQGVGRRWRLRVDALRRAALSNDMPVLGAETPENYEDDMKFSENSIQREAAADFEAPDFGAGAEEPRRGSNASAPVSQSPISEDGNVPLFIETRETGAQTEVQMEERETWTGESLTHRFLCVSVCPVLGGSVKGFSCRLTYGQQTHHVKLPAAPAPRPPQPLPFTKKITIQEKGSILGLRKSPSGSQIRSPGTASRENPPTILKRGALFSPKEVILESHSDEVRFDLPSVLGQREDAKLQLVLYLEAEGIVATGELLIPQDIPEAVTVKVPLLGAGARSRSPHASLSLKLCCQEEVLPRCRDQNTQAWSLLEVVREATGIDLQLTSPEELQRLLQPSPKVQEVSTSPFPLPLEPTCQDSSTSPMPGTFHSPAMDDFTSPATDYQGHNFLQKVIGEMTALQKIPESELQMLMNTFTPSLSGHEDTENLQRSAQTVANINEAAERNWAIEPAGQELEPDLSRPAEDRARKKTPMKDVSRSLLLRRALPKDVWQRMQQLEDVMQKNKQNTLEKLRSASSESLERQLSSQHRIQTSPEQDNICQDDVCLPALFMPTKLGHLFTPKAHLYFHPSGSGNTLRLTQPPSVLSLPPLSSQNKLSVLNLLEPGVSLTLWPGQRSREKNNRRESPEERDTLPAVRKDVGETTKEDEFYEQFVGATLNGKESLSPFATDSGEKMEDRDLAEKIVVDVAEASEPLSTVVKDTEETADLKEIMDKAVGDYHHAKESVSTVEDYKETLEQIEFCQ